jgi:N-acyl-D-amino-acid deacylase
VFDVVVRNGKVVDGTGNPWFYGDIGIAGNRIAAIQPRLEAEAAIEIDATNMYVSPGFVDIHSHSDLTLIVDSAADSKVRQGVTTDVSGNCGNSGAPLAGEHAVRWCAQSLNRYGVEVTWRTFSEYLERIELAPLSSNFASFVGHHQIRMSVIGYENRRPTPSELDAMKRLVREAMESGAVGISTGLDRGLVPGSFADTDEVIELCKEAARVNPRAVYTSHIRNRQAQVIDAVSEFLHILREAGLPGQLSHITPRVPDGDKVAAILSMLDEARDRGIDVTCDVVCPEGSDYHPGEGILFTQVMPGWAVEGTPEDGLRRLRDPAGRKRMKRECDPLWGVIKAGMWDTLYLTKCDGSPQFVGRSIADISASLGVDPWEACYNILVSEGPGFRSVRVLSSKHTRECDTRDVLMRPYVSVQSDRAAVALEGPLQMHGGTPNAYDAFPRFLQRYVRDERVLSLEDAIRRITSLPCSRLHLQDRGVLRPGMVADVAIFDLHNMGAKSAFLGPAQYPEGIDSVIVGGEVVVSKGAMTGVLGGRVIRAM